LSVPGPITVRVVNIAYCAPDIHSYELMSPTGDELPAFTAGAHVELKLSNGLSRQYSLHNRAGETRRYQIAVKLEAAGRGGSRHVHKEIRVGDLVSISAPINHFELTEGAAGYVLIGAGIGITPIIAMARRLREIDADFVLHYCGRSHESLAFLEELREICGDRLVLHIDGGDPARGLDAKRLVEELSPGTEVYCCGPASLNAAVRDAAPSERRGTLHFESFASAALPVPLPGDASHEVEIASTGQIVPVAAGQSVLDALRNAGCDVPSSCEAGTCGTCKVRLVKGEVDHQDFVLTDDEQRDSMLVCVSRPVSGRITLDLTPL
jgi:ferredoxin-NADP reductase